MGLYDFLIKYNIDEDTLIQMVYDLSKFVYIGKVENTVRDIDDLYDDKEFKKQTKEHDNGI